jgi:hypothetical protein
VQGFRYRCHQFCCFAKRGPVIWLSIKSAD